jgi:hypothetical protein
MRIKLAQYYLLAAMVHPESVELIEATLFLLQDAKAVVRSIAKVTF